MFFAGWLLVALFLWHGSLLWGGQVLCGRDLVDYFIPLRDGQMAHGWFAPWHPETFSGRPAVEDIQAGILYPPNWLHLLPMQSERVITMLTMLHLFVGGLGFCFLAGERCRRAAALLAGVLWMAGAYQVLRVHTGVVVFNYALAWVPWMWLAAERQALAGGRLLWTAWLAAFGALQLTAGAPQMVQITWAGLAIWTVARMIAAHGPRAGVAGGFVLAGIATLLVGAPALTGALALQAEAAARGGADAWTFLSDGSLQPRVMLTWLFPDFFAPAIDESLYWGSTVGFSETNIYLGIVPVVQAAMGLAGAVMRRGGGARERRWLATMAALAMIGWLIALGSHGFLFRLLVDFIPSFDLFRVPARWLLWVVAPSVLLAAWGLEELLGWAESRRDQPLTPVLGAVLPVIIVLALARALALPLLESLGLDAMLARVPAEFVEVRERLLATPLASIQTALALAVLAGLLASLHVAGRLGARPAVVLMLALAMIDLRMFWSPYNTSVPTDVTSPAIETESIFHRVPANHLRTFYFPETPAVDFARTMSPDGRMHYDDSALSYVFDQEQRELLMERPKSLGLAVTRGYTQVHLASYVADYYASFPGENPGAFLPQMELGDRRFLDAYNVHWFLTYPQFTPAEQLQALGLEAGPQLTAAGLQAWRNPAARGWAWLSPEQDFLSSEPDPGAGAVMVQTREANHWRGTVEVKTAPAYLHISSADSGAWRLVVEGDATVENSRTALLKQPGVYTFERIARHRGLAPGPLGAMLAGVLMIVALFVCSLLRRPAAPQT